MKDSEQTAKLAANLQRQIHMLIKSHDMCDQVCLVRHGVTASQGYALLALKPEGDLTMNEISGLLRIASSTMTRTIDPLVAKGLVYRKIDDSDRRIVRVGLTPKGREIRKSIEDSLQDFFMIVVKEIGRDDRPSVLAAMEQVTKALKSALQTCCTVQE